MKKRSGRMCRRGGKITFDPVRTHIEFVSGGGVTGTHHKHVSDRHCGDPGMDMLRELFREMPNDRVIQRKPALLREQTDGNRGKAFADGEHAMQRAGITGGIISLKKQFVMTHQEQAVHGNPASGKAFRKPDNGIARNADGFRSSFFKSKFLHLVSPHLLLWFCRRPGGQTVIVYMLNPLYHILFAPPKKIIHKI